ARDCALGGGRSLRLHRLHGARRERRRPAESEHARRPLGGRDGRRRSRRAGDGQRLRAPRPSLPAAGHRERDSGPCTCRLPRQRARPVQGRTPRRRRRHAPERRLRREAGLARDEVPLEVHAGQVLEDVMAQLGRAALLIAFGLVAYALIAGSYAAWKRRRRLALSAQNPLLAAFPVTLIAAIILLVALGRPDMTFVHLCPHPTPKPPPR